MYEIRICFPNDNQVKNNCILLVWLTCPHVSVNPRLLANVLFYLIPKSHAIQNNKRQAVELLFSLRINTISQLLFDLILEAISLHDVW
jgi:hypothetical protein